MKLSTALRAVPPLFLRNTRKTDRDPLRVGARAGVSNRSPEERVEKTTGCFRSLPVTARLRSKYFITFGGPQGHGHSVEKRLRVCSRAACASSRSRVRSGRRRRFSSLWVARQGHGHSLPGHGFWNGAFAGMGVAATKATGSGARVRCSWSSGTRRSCGLCRDGRAATPGSRQGTAGLERGATRRCD